jgi:hypothetical protein
MNRRLTDKFMRIFRKTDGRANGTLSIFLNNNIQLVANMVLQGFANINLLATNLIAHLDSLMLFYNSRYHTPIIIRDDEAAQKEMNSIFGSHATACHF